MEGAGAYMSVQYTKPFFLSHFLTVRTYMMNMIQWRDFRVLLHARDSSSIWRWLDAATMNDELSSR